MYPRFVMMIINDRLPNLPTVQPIRKVTTLLKRSYNEFTTRNANDPNAQDVELFGAIVDIDYKAPSDELIASGEDLPVATPQQQQQRQPISQSEAISQQLNVMLDEQAVNPSLAQAVIHEILQENAPVDDPIADTEAYQDIEVTQDEALEIAAAADREKAKKIVVDEDNDDSSSKTSSDNSVESDDSDDVETEQRAKIVRMGSKVVIVGDSSSGKKRKEREDVDYSPEEEEATPQVKRTKAAENEPSTIRPVSAPTRSPSLIATPFQFQLNDLNNKLKIMEGTIRAQSAELENQKKKHEKEIRDQKVQHLRDMNLIKMRVDRLNTDLDRERAKNADMVSKSELDVLFEDFLMRRGLIPDLGCKGDELQKRNNNDQNDDPDAAQGGNQERHFSGDMSKAIVLFEGEASQADASSENVQEAAEIDQGFDNTSLFNTSSLDLSDHKSLIREIQIKYGHDKMLAENVYADLMERKFQEETANELSKTNSELCIVDSLSSSDSEYVPEKDK